MDNRPAKLDNITAFRDSDFILPIRFEESYDISNLSVSFKVGRTPYDLSVSPAITDNLAVINIPKDQVEDFPNNIDLYIFNGNQSLLMASISVKMGGVDIHDPETEYNVTITDGDIVVVEVFGLDIVKDQVQLAIQAASDTALDRIAVGEDKIEIEQNVATTNQNVIATESNKNATAADVIQTGQYKAGTSADLAQTILNKNGTASDLLATSSNLVKTVISEQNAQKYAADAERNRNQSLGPFKFQGVWNPVTNTPNLAALGLTNTDADKNKFWISIAYGANSISGSSEIYQIGDGPLWNGTNYLKIPKSDYAIASIQEFKKGIVVTEDDKFSLSDEDGYTSVLFDAITRIFDVDYLKALTLTLPNGLNLKEESGKLGIYQGVNKFLSVSENKINDIGFLKGANGETKIGNMTFVYNPDIDYEVTDEDGYTYYDISKIEIPRLAVNLAASRYIHILVYGQSLSTGFLAVPALSTAPLDRVFTFVGGEITSVYADSNGYNSLVPFRTGINPDYPNETASYGIASGVLQYLEANYVDTSKLEIIISNPGQGGTTLAQLDKPSVHYTRLLESVIRAKSIADSQGKSYSMPCLVWLQGEADRDTDTQVYKNLMIQFRNDLTADVKAITGQAEDVEIVTYQTQLSEATSPGSTLAQYELGISQPGFHLGNPMHMFYYQPDQTHLLNLSSLRMGASLAPAVAEVVCRRYNWRPVYINNIVRQGSELYLTFNLPVGGRLFFDIVNVINPGNYGFQLLSGSSNKTISSVTIEKPNLIKIVCSEPIPVGWELRYAIRNGIAGQSGPLNGSRGCVRDSKSFLFNHPSGYYNVYNWLPAFRTFLT